MSRPPEDRAAVFAALAKELDLARVQERFGLTREELARMFEEAAAVFCIDDCRMWSLYCDGACRGNPGPAGAGFVLYDGKEEPRARESHYLGETTNNVAEYQALILGLNKALELGVQNLAVFSDSELMVRQLNGQYQVKKPHLLPLWHEARKALQKFRHCAISHLDRAFNHEADRLARQAIDQRGQKR
jgi:ribonuclease HI